MAVLYIFNFLLQHLAGVVVVLVAACDLLLEFLYVDLYVSLDLFRFCLKHVPQFRTLVLQPQNRQRVIRDFFVYFQDLGIDFL